MEWPTHLLIVGGGGVIIDIQFLVVYIINN